MQEQRAEVKTTNKEELHKLRHSAAHILAQAVKRLWPQTRLAIGPPIDEGFYYDVSPEKPITEEDLSKLEAEMASPDFYTDKVAAQDTITRHQSLMWEVGDLMNQWETLQHEATEKTEA